MDYTLKEKQIKPNRNIISNNIYNANSSKQIVERQMISYTNIFKNIADQISDLNSKFSGLKEAAE